ncbi:MAG: hypothetical protein ACFFEV_10770 [Candidatus Thorarchaeota archaeon]
MVGTTANRQLISFTILVLFVIFVSIPIIFIITGVMWQDMSQGQLVFWLTLDTVIGSLSAGIVFIYSLERYKQEQLFRDLLLVMICITVIITGVLYLITSPAFEGLSPFVNRNRNRVIILFEGLIIAASPLLGSLVNENPIQQGERLRLILLNGLIGPLLALYGLLTPIQFITMASPELGPFEFRPEALILFIVLLIVMVVSLVKSFKAYLTSRVSVDLGISLLMALLIVGALLVSMVVNPMSVLEVSWHAAYVEGFVIIGVSFMMDVVVDPFRALKTLVSKRTEELAESKRESEYYLNIWSHKVGNLLQEMQLLLELLNLTSDLDEMKKLSYSSMMLVNEVEAINRQVRILSRIKSRQEEDLFPVSMNDAISTAIHEVNAVTSDIETEITFNRLEQNSHVLADDLLHTVPFNISMYIIRDLTVEKPKINVSLSESSDYLIIRFQYEGKHIPEEILAALNDTLDPSRTTLGLDVFAVKALLNDYGGTFVYEDSPSGGQFIASIRKAPSFQ